MPFRTPLPQELEVVKASARRALGAVIPSHPGSVPFVADLEAGPPRLFAGSDRTDAGRAFPPAYVVYFLLIDLLEFPHFGAYEKVAWSVGIDYKGRLLTISHRKFGIGVFAPKSAESNVAAREVTIRIQKAVKAAQPYFDWRAGLAVAESKLNVRNNARPLYDAMSYFLAQYASKITEAEARKDEKIVETGAGKHTMWTRTTWPALMVRRETGWVAIAAIEAFFSWTEHIFIHIAILRGQLLTGAAVTARAEADWADKYKGAIDVSDPEAKRHFDSLISVRRELRNFVAHGAFGKDGQAFQFHSTAGAVPVLLPHRASNRSFSIGEDLQFNHAAAIASIEAFNTYVWTKERAPAKTHIQEYGLPAILTHTTDGRYAHAMASTLDMEQFCDYLIGEIDRASNMEW